LDFFFEKIGKDLDGIERDAGNFCKKDFAIGKNPRSGRNYGTSHFFCHVCCCKTILSNLNSLEKPFSMTEINQKIHRSLLAEVIVAHDLPFSFVEFDKI